MTERDILKAPKTFCLTADEGGYAPECIGCEKEMKPGRFYLADKAAPEDISLVEGFVCPECAAKRISGAGRRGLLVSLVFAALMLLSLWLVMDPLKVYIQNIYIPVIVVLIAAAVYFLFSGVLSLVKRASEARAVLESEDYDKIFMNEFAADDGRKRIYRRV